jgi:DNA-binding NarL/FixJ family response regulator
VLLLDLHLQDGDGMDLCRKISKTNPGLKVLGLSGVEDPGVISHFLKNGAKGYLLKSAGGAEILDGIRKVNSGDEYLSNEIKLQVIKQISDATKRSSSGYIPNLSMREKEVLKLIVDELTTQEIAEKLFISVNTVETHRNHLLQKLGAKNVAGLVRIALEKGLLS